MLSDVEITGDHSVPRLVSFMPSLSCHSLRPSFLCQSLSIAEGERVYLVGILYKKICIHGRKFLESKAGDGSEYGACRGVQLSPEGFSQVKMYNEVLCI